jgi:predicted NACHT family NTPase
MRDRSAPQIPAQTVINNQKKAVVLGAPGSGKTMLASYFALMLCETTQSDPTNSNWLQGKRISEGIVGYRFLTRNRKREYLNS